jgi:hypothetical protein
MNPTISREQVEHEARAKIFWGDEPETVVRFLMLNKIDPEEASEIVEDLVRERIANVRGIGVKKIVVGTGMIIVPVATYLAMYSGGVIYVKILGVAVAFGLWGAYKVLKGTIMLVLPESEKSDLADSSD